MKKQLEKMKKHLAANQPKEFSKALARLGRQMMKNRFVFESFLGEAGRKGVKMTLDFQGERILPFEKRVMLDQFFVQKYNF